MYMWAHARARRALPSERAVTSHGAGARAPRPSSKVCSFSASANARARDGNHAGMRRRRPRRRLVLALVASPGAAMRNHSTALKAVFNSVKELRRDFGASSLYDPILPELWVRGATNTIPRLAELSRIVGGEGHAPRMPLASFNTTAGERLTSLFNERRSDKGDHDHNYGPMYTSILDELRQSTKRLRLLEIGLGSHGKFVSSMGAFKTRPGASLRAFRDYLGPSASIFGADVDEHVLFREEQIETAQVDQLDADSLENLYSRFGNRKFDLVIDDGLHAGGANINVLAFGLRHVRPGGYVVIEDVGHERWRGPEHVLDVADHILRSGWGTKAGARTWMLRASNTVSAYVVRLPRKE